MPLMPWRLTSIPATCCNASATLVTPNFFISSAVTICMVLEFSLNGKSIREDEIIIFFNVSNSCALDRIVKRKNTTSIT